ncbi:ABC-2 type transport system ATP-binding protein [Actinoplanes octamycinicus]|uniref:ABC-2 type transport system ATP-binding protein n=1 Tax=Actinoplanes octamycinicus TaxID=135948 RepID=A0A7W7MC54_9ACTN|nr:ABC transporter ATP-binding protein [Actinoplanes octamycinicus]MBB4744814.1 ABC-2 type transport system ATP-binding protein [Actinoplanes octamycinicus]
MNPITCAGVHFGYRHAPVVRGVDLAVRPGELVALLGTNGAGKTTTMDLLLGQRRPDAGTIRVLGRDPCADRRRLTAEVGVLPQESGCAPGLTVAETVRLWLRLHGRRDVHRATAALLTEVELTHRADLRAGRLSGGERRRLDLAVALTGRPRLLLLDEPTTGLDPQSRAHTWALLRALREQGVTILLTTHYLEEAEALADRIAIMDAGRVVFTGTLDEAGGPGSLATTFHRIAGQPR